MCWYEMVFSSRGWRGPTEQIDWVQQQDGKLIVAMKLSLPGYWDITFEDGTEMRDVHTSHIIPSKGVSERSGAW